MKQVNGRAVGGNAPVNQTAAGSGDLGGRNFKLTRGEILTDNGPLMRAASPASIA